VKSAIITDVEDEKSTAAWKGLKIFATQTNLLKEYKVSKREYEENGPRILKKFYL
jgi:actin-related protein